MGTSKLTEVPDNWLSVICKPSFLCGMFMQHSSFDVTSQLSIHIKFSPSPFGSACQTCRAIWGMHMQLNVTEILYLQTSGIFKLRWHINRNLLM